jgi:uncharacterized protein YdeI (YjbR/CyaY-like superfamily)
MHEPGTGDVEKSQHVGVRGQPQVEPPLIEPVSRFEWREWLAAHGDDGHGVWLVLHKGRGAPLRYPDAVEEALAAGWIDSKANKLDPSRYKVWMAPRKRGSGWSPVDKERVARLTDQGLMTSRGEAVVQAARTDGSWWALDEVMSLQIPADLRAALESDLAAADNFELFPPSSKRIILEWLRQTKNPDTRLRRLEEIVTLAAQNVRAHHFRQPQGEPSTPATSGAAPREGEER